MLIVSPLLLVKEIANLGEPIGFERIEIDSIAQKYLSLGNAKEQVVDNFISLKFTRRIQFLEGWIVNNMIMCF